MIGAAIAGATLVLARAWHAAALRRARRLQRAQRRFNADGIVAGAEGFTLRGVNGRGVLLLHGSGDSPQSLRYLAHRLHDTGFTVHAPLLPGHGRDVREFTSVTDEAYRAAAESALDRLLAETPRVSVGGLSMGGALAARLAADRHEVKALVLLAPYLDAPASVRWAVRTAPLWGFAIPFAPGGGERSVHDAAAAAEGLAYGVFSPAALRALLAAARSGRDALARISVPTLVVHSTEDNRISVPLAERSTSALRGHTERHWVAGCGHVITVDYCKAQVADLVLDFLARHGA